MHMDVRAFGIRKLSKLSSGIIPNLGICPILANARRRVGKSILIRCIILCLKYKHATSFSPFSGKLKMAIILERIGPERVIIVKLVTQTESLIWSLISLISVVHAYSRQTNSSPFRATPANPYQDVC